MSGTRGRPAPGLLLFLLLLAPSCGEGTGTEQPQMVEIIAWATLRTGSLPGFLDLTVVREGAEPVFADSVESPCTLPLSARSGDLVYVDLKWTFPQSGTLQLWVGVEGEHILYRDSIYPNSALVVTFWVP